MPITWNFTFIKKAVHIHQKHLGTFIEIENGRLEQTNCKARLFDGQGRQKAPILLFWTPVWYLLL